MPEKLPTPNKSLKELETEKKNNKSNNINDKIDGKVENKQNMS